MGKKTRFTGKQVAVLGLGREGIEVVRLMRGFNAEVTVLDSAPAKKLANYDAAKKLGAEFQLDKEYMIAWDRFDMIVRSPGVPLDLPELKKAKRRGVEITSSTKIFFELCPAKIIGITGSKGKSTTSSLIAHLLTERGRKVWLGGNIGASPLPALSKMKPTDWVVLELSSFQLEDMEVSPHIAVLLEVVPEHLDRHKTFAKYFAAKQNIYRYQKKNDWLVTSIDYPTSRKAIRETKGKVFEYSLRHVLRRGIYRDGEDVIYRDVKTGSRMVVGDVFTKNLLGRHNNYNKFAAMGAAILAGVAPDKLTKRMASFKPLPHRLEVVRDLSGVWFVDDSMATTPEATEAAVLAFAHAPKALILGGVPKGGEWEPTIKTIGLGGVEYVALIGTAAKKLKGLFKKHAPRVETEIHTTFKGAIKSCYKAVKKGGVVLLSPGCASFDMFNNAYERGEKFAAVSNAL